LSLSLSIFVLFLSSQHALSFFSLSRFLFSSFLLDIYIGAAKERKEITRHPPPSLTLSLRARRARAQEEQEREENKNFR
jgi:hypothetical protein